MKSSRSFANILMHCNQINVLLCTYITYHGMWSQPYLLTSRTVHGQIRQSSLRAAMSQLPCGTSGATERTGNMADQPTRCMVTTIKQFPGHHHRFCLFNYFSFNSPVTMVRFQLLCPDIPAVHEPSNSNTMLKYNKCLHINYLENV